MRNSVRSVCEECKNSKYSQFKPIPYTDLFEAPCGCIKPPKPNEPDGDYLEVVVWVENPKFSVNDIKESTGKCRIGNLIDKLGIALDRIRFKLDSIGCKGSEFLVFAVNPGRPFGYQYCEQDFYRWYKQECMWYECYWDREGYNRIMEKFHA